MRVANDLAITDAFARRIESSMNRAVLEIVVG
jgi:hypothetical protein